MLYDPKWEVETKPDVFSLENLVAWAEKQPAEKEYDFCCTQCYLGQYFEAHGYQVAMLGTDNVTFVDRGKARRVDLPPHFNAIAQDEPRTFGAALSRARKALAR